MRLMLLAALLIVAATVAAVHWIGPALRWAEWLLVGWVLCFAVVVWLMERAPDGFEDDAGWHEGQEFGPESWDWPERAA